MVDVKSASGKSMMVNKATLEKIMANKAIKKSAMITTDDSEKLLAENEDIGEDITEKGSLLFSPTTMKMRTRGQGV